MGEFIPNWGFSVQREAKTVNGLMLQIENIFIKKPAKNKFSNRIGRFLQ